MVRIILHENANAKTVAFTRIFLCTLCFIYIAHDHILNLSFLDSELFFRQGIFNLFPISFYAKINAYGFLLCLKVMLMLGFLLSALGMGKRILIGTIAVFILYIGIEKGFGGHVNHSELFIIYMLFCLTLTPAWDAWAIKKESGERNPHAYHAGMLMILAIPIIEYLFIGFARLTIGFPEVFHPEVMKGWIIQRQLRPSDFDFDLLKNFIHSPTMDTLSYFIMPLSTILEIAALGLLFLKGKKLYLLIFSLLMMHLGIMLIMNISFMENMAVLLLFLPFTDWIDKKVKN